MAKLVVVVCVEVDVAVLVEVVFWLVVCSVVRSAHQITIDVAAYFLVKNKYCISYHTPPVIVVWVGDVLEVVSLLGVGVEVALLE